MKRILLAGALFLVLSSPALAQRSKVKSIKGTRYEVTSRYDAHLDGGLEKMLAPYKQKVDSLMKPVVGYSEKGMSGGRPESLLGNWVADALVTCSDFDGKGKADFGLANMGGLRSNMPQGIVRKGDVMQIAPFENLLCVVQLKGTQLLELFRNIASVGGEALSKEVRLKINKKRQLVSVTVSGHPINPEQLYNVATLDYLAEGNDKMTALTHREGIRQSKMPVRDVLILCLQKSKTIDANIEGRVVVEE